MDIRRRNSLRMQYGKTSHYRWRKGHSRRSWKTSSCTTERQCLYSVGKGNKELRNICKVFLKKTCFRPLPPIFCLRSRLGAKEHSAKCISCFCEENIPKANRHEKKDTQKQVFEAKKGRFLKNTFNYFDKKAEICAVFSSGTATKEECISLYGYD